MLNSDILKVWLKKEMEGYEYNDTLLPIYRIIPSALFLSIAFPFNNRKTFPGSFDDAPNDLKELIQNHRITEPIIYGSGNPANIAAGYNVHQSNIINPVPETDLLRMKELGVSDEQ